MHCWLHQNGPHRTRPDFHLCEPKERCNRSVAQKEGRQPSHTAFLYINQISPVKMVNVINRDNDFTVHRVHRECVFSCVASVVLAQLHSSRSFVWNLSLFVSVGVKIAIIHFLNPTCHAEYISNVSPFLNWFPLFFLPNYIRIFSAKHILHISGYLPAIPRSIFFIKIRNNFMMCRRILRSSNNVHNTPQCQPQLNNTINFLTAGRHAFWWPQIKIWNWIDALRRQTQWLTGFPAVFGSYSVAVVNARSVSLHGHGQPPK